METLRGKKLWRTRVRRNSRCLKHLQPVTKKYILLFFRRNVSSIALCESQGRCGSGTMIIYSGAMIEALVKYAGILCLVNVIKLAAQYAAIKKEK
jgi:hypothetical protein